MSSSRKNRLPSNRERCAFCGENVGVELITRDHLIPKWVRRVLATHNRPVPQLGTVGACNSCNADKGGMPAYRFILLRGQPKLLSRERGLWHSIRQTVKKASADPDMLEFVINQFDHPFLRRELILRTLELDLDDAEKS